MPSTHVTRRQLLLAGSAMAAFGSARAQPGKAAGRPVTIAQIIDTSPAQQDVSKDILIGARAFWQDANSKGGFRGRQVQHAAIETDGSAASLRTAVDRLKDANAVALSGTAGDLAALHTVERLRQERISIAHAAPWLQAGAGELDDQTFPIFATRQEQVAHAFKSLSVMSVSELGVVYAGDVEFGAYQQDFARIARDLKLRLRDYRGAGDLSLLGQQLGPESPAILLFVGGTPELARFTLGLEKQARKRYIVALADVNLQTMMQMGAARSTPVIATQPVPVVTASLPLVRAYREALSKFFDEPPASLSLVGYIAARYTFEVLNDIPGEISRQSALAAFRQRATLDMGGFRVAFDSRRHAGSYVTQSMITADGRVIG